MTVRALALSRRIDELLATTDPFAVHESVTSYLASVEEPLLQKMLLLSIPNLDEQSRDVLCQELVKEGSGAALSQAIAEPRAPGELATAVSRFLALEPRALASLAPPLLAGYLAHIASLQGDTPGKKLDTRVLAGAGVVALGILLFLHSVGTPNRDEAPYPVVPSPMTMKNAALAAQPHGNLLLHTHKAVVHRKLNPRRARAWASRPIVRHTGKPKRLAIAPRHYGKYHRKHYSGSGTLVRRNLQRGGRRVALRQHFHRRGSATGRGIARKRRTTALNNRRPHPTVFHGVFKPFRWVLFKPVHRGPG